MIIIIFSDKNCEYQAISSLRSLERKITDNIKILYYTIGFDSEYSCKNLYKIKIDLNSNYPCYNYYKPELCLKSLEMFPNEEYFIYADTDILYSKRLNFEALKHTDEYPLASYGPHEYPFIYRTVDNNCIIYNETELMKYVGVENRTMRYVFSCFFSFNKKCVDFLKEWLYFCNNKDLLTQEDIYFPFKDETSFNVCLWKKNAKNNLGFSFLNTHQHEIVNLVENDDHILDKYGTNIDQAGVNWEYIQNSKNIIFYHGFKTIEHIQPTLDILLKSVPSGSTILNNPYTNLNLHKKAYVVCAVGQKYIDSTEGLIKSLKKYSKYPVILYYSNGIVNYTYDNLILQPFNTMNVLDNTHHTGKLFTTLKAEVTLGSLKNYNVDTVIMLDSDIIVTRNIDNIFDEYESQLENYPIFMKYAWDIVSVLGRPLVSDYIKEYIGVNISSKIYSICSCTCIANKNCLSFLEDWKSYCEDKHLIEYHYETNKEIYFDFNDESIANALLWKYNATKVLPTNLQWAWKHESVKFALDFYEGKTEQLQRHSSLQTTHWKIPDQYEVPYGLSVIPLNKKDLWGFHGPKDLNEINLILNELETRF